MGLNVGVIGAGFSGLLAARKLLDLGVEVKVFEEHERVGYPEHCTGLVSGRVVKAVGEEAESSIIKTYDYIDICYKDECVRLKIRDKLYKLDRVRLEIELLRSVLRRGGEVLFKTKVVSVNPWSGRILTSKGRSYDFDLVILSEGFGGRLRERLGIGLSKKYRPLIGINFEVQDECTELSGPKVIFGTSYSKDFFVWMLPLPDDNCLLGSASRDPKSVIRLIKGKSVIKSYGGPVITGPPAKSLWIGKVFVIGDAAGLNKPLTGGGLYPNSLTFALLERSVKREVVTPDKLSKALYNSLRAVVKELSRSYRLSKAIYDNLDIIRCGVKILRTHERRLPPVEYDNHLKTVKDVLVSSPTRYFDMMLKIISSCPLTFSKFLISLLK